MKKAGPSLGLKGELAICKMFWLHPLQISVLKGLVLKGLRPKPRSVNSLLPLEDEVWESGIPIPKIEESLEHVIQGLGLRAWGLEFKVCRDCIGSKPQ